MDANDAKNITGRIVREYGLTYSSIAARTTSFQDLTRGAAVFVTVKGMDWPTWLKNAEAIGTRMRKEAPGVLLTPAGFVNLPAGVVLIDA
jgi:hypothetical protein